MTGDALLAQLVTTIERMQAQIDALQAQVATLTVQQRLGGRPVEDEPASSSEDLARWVNWLIDTYDVAETIPACWDRHPSIRAELSALHAAHVGANDKIDGRPSDPVHWHEALPRCLARIRDWDKSKCRARGHLEEAG